MLFSCRLWSTNILVSCVFLSMTSHNSFPYILCGASVFLWSFANWNQTSASSRGFTCGSECMSMFSRVESRIKIIVRHIRMRKPANSILQIENFCMCQSCSNQKSDLNLIEQTSTLFWMDFIQLSITLSSVAVEIEFRAMKLSELDERRDVQRFCFFRTERKRSRHHTPPPSLHIVCGGAMRNARREEDEKKKL